MKKCDPFKQAYQTQKANAKRRGIAFLLSFDQWLEIWIASGYWTQRGRGSKFYCMSRINDIGAYEVGNVLIVQNCDNIIEGNLGRIHSKESRNARSKSNPMRKPVSTPKGLFDSILSAAQAANVSRTLVARYCRENRQGVWRFI
jgi:hypothetical protein